MMPEKNYVGKHVKRIDALGKVTGELKYMSDVEYPNMLWGKILKSPAPHALIKSIDISKAKNLPGVVCVLTHKDVPGLNGFGIVIQDQPVLCADKVRYEGDAVALVAAETKEIAQEAIRLIDVQYEPLPIVDDMEKALDPESEKVHANGNILLRNELQKGDIKQGFEESEIILEASYETQRMEHAFLETEGGVGIYHEKDGVIEIFCGAQHPYRDQLQVSRSMNWQKEKIILHESPVGGGFGAKDEITIQIYLALLALYSKRPVKIWLEREESVRTHVKRHPMRLKFKLGAKKDGILKALDVYIVSDTGAYASLGGPVLNLALEGAPGPYKIPHSHLLGYAMYTNNGISGAFRGFGTTQSCFGMEITLDKLAEKLNIDPLELRLKNCIHKDDISGIDHNIFTSVGIEQTLQIALESEIWKKRHDRKKEFKPPLFYGVGTASEMQALGLGKDIPDFANAELDFLANGKFVLRMSSIEMGQGNITCFAQMTADCLKCKIEDVFVIHGDTGRTPDSGPTSASKSIYLIGNATYDAAKKLITEIEDAAYHITGRKFKYEAGELKFEAEKISLRDFALLLKGNTNKNAKEFDALLTTKGYFEHPVSDKSYGDGLPHCLYAFITQVVSVVVDSETGETRVLEVLSIPDCGKAINPTGVEAQCEGGSVQGIAYALYEDCIIEKGKFKNPHFSTYILPTASDVPMKNETIIVESYEGTHPFGAKGMAEPPCVAICPAILNAIYDAVGVRISSIPATPEKVLKAIKEKKNI